MSTTQIILAIVVAVLGSNALSVLITFYFTRQQTSANVGETEAKTSGSYVEQVQSLVKELKAGMERVSEVHGQLTTCLSDKSRAEIKTSELEADNRHLKSAIALVTEENTKKDELITELRGRLRDYETR